MNKALVQLTVTRVREIFRQPEAIFWTFLFPVLMSVVLGVAFRSERPDPSAAVVVEGRGPTSSRPPCGGTPRSAWSGWTRRRRTRGCARGGRRSC